MSTIKNTFKIFIITITFSLFSTNYSFAQLNGFVLTPSGTTDNFMKYVPVGTTISGANYVTGYLTMSAYKNITTSQWFDPGLPVQKLQLQGGNILLCRTNAASVTPDLNPTSRNGAILFSDIIQTAYGYVHGKWGIEYDDQYSTGGLNFFKPKSSLTSSRINFNLFIRNDGNVGIANNNPLQRLDVNGNILLAGINSTILFADSPPSNGNWGKWGIEYESTGLNFWKPYESSGMENQGTYDPKSKGAFNYVLFLHDNGRVGIGTNMPEAQFHVKGNAMFQKVGIGTNNPLTDLQVNGSVSIGYESAVPTLAKSLIVNGNVGIGIAIPTSKLDVKGDIAVSGGIYGKPSDPNLSKLELFGSSELSAAKIEIGDGITEGAVYLITRKLDAPIQFKVNGKWAMGVTDKFVSIGDPSHQEEATDLKVYGKIFAREVKVTLDTWYDNVFDPDYKILALADLDAYISKNKHLPEIPSEKEVLENGVNVGEMNALLLKKIEELTLYVIQQQKQIDEQQNEMKAIKGQLTR